MVELFNYFFLAFCSFFAIYCWFQADKEEQWSFRWWYDIFCSALNGVFAISIASKFFL